MSSDVARVFKFFYALQNYAASSLVDEVHLISKSWSDDIATASMPTRVIFCGRLFSSQ